jgi:molybdopterin/thiamine biosynthesis adenylyltransferase
VLKNLVLAGVGRITIADSGKVDFNSLSSNYYFQVEDIGQEVNIKKSSLYNN